MTKRLRMAHGTSRRAEPPCHPVILSNAVYAARSTQPHDPQPAAALQYVVVPGWNVRQLCQNSWYAVTDVSVSTAPRPLSA